MNETAGIADVVGELTITSDNATVWRRLKAKTIIVNEYSMPTESTENDAIRRQQTAASKFLAETFSHDTCIEAF